MSNGTDSTVKFDAARRSRRRARIVALLATVALPVLAWALSGSPFEGADGDLVASAGIDSDSLVAGPRL